jgi:hypothetical protein
MFAVTIRDEEGELLIGVVEREEDVPRLIHDREWRIFTEEQSQSCRHGSVPAMSPAEVKAVFSQRLVAAARRSKVSRL